MDPRHFTTSTCAICGDVETGRFSSQRHYCPRHQRDEISFHQSLQEGKLTTEQKQLRMIYRRRWSRQKAGSNEPAAQLTPEQMAERVHDVFSASVEKIGMDFYLPAKKAASAKRGTNG